MAIYLNIIQWKYIAPIYTIAPIYANETGIKSYFFSTSQANKLVFEWNCNKIIYMNIINLEAESLIPYNNTKNYKPNFTWKDI